MSQTTINYVVGDVTRPLRTSDRHRIVAHVCNNAHKFGAGVAAAIAARWPDARDAYLADVSHELGSVRFIPVGSEWISVANMIAQWGVRSRWNPTPIRYDALRECLRAVAKYAEPIDGERSDVHMPRIGCGLAGGKWSEVEPIVVEELCRRGVSVTVYDLPQRVT